MTDRPELRQDIVSSEWVLVAPGRRKRAKHFISASPKPTPKRLCPFENPQENNGPALLWYSKDGARGEGEPGSSWAAQVVPNKFPAVIPHRGSCPTALHYGLYRHMAGIGFHEIVITRTHDKFLADMTTREAELVARAYQDRMITHGKEKCLEYIFIFHNHGQAAGATVWHPHSQIIALPIIPPDVQRSLSGAKLYFLAHKKCVHCEIILWEKKKKERILYENRGFLVLTPFASHVAFEMRIFPKAHMPRFESITTQDRLLFADALTTALRKLKKLLKNPAYNFFIHTAPLKKEKYDYYHWHVEILPKTAHHAGVELGTGIDVVTMTPEEAARLLKK